MSARILRILPRHVWRVVLPVATGAVLFGMPAGSTLAQQAEGAAHTTPSGENKGGHLQAPPLNVAPAKERSIVHGGANAIDHNAIGMSIVRRNGGQKPAALNLGRAATLAPPVSPVAPAPSGAAVGLGSRALAAPHLPAPASRPMVLSRGTINGAAFVRPGTAPAPLGGPAKQAATGINGTSFQPKH